MFHEERALFVGQFDFYLSWKVVHHYRQTHDSSIHLIYPFSLLTNILSLTAYHNHSSTSGGKKLVGGGNLKLMPI